jgi:outer membrane lipoprotein-sorting protein
MIRSISVIFAVLGLSAAPAAAGKKAAATPATSAETIVAKHLEAQGGLARLKARSSVAFTATETFDGKTVQVSGTRARPNLFRYEIGGEQAKVKGFDGKVGWVSKAGAVEMITGEKLAAMHRSDFDDALIDASARGHRVALAGTASVNGAPAHVLELTLASGDVQKRYIDTKTFLEVKRVARYTHDGKRGEKTMTFRDFKTVNGITSPMTTEFEKDGKRGTYTVTSIEHDRPVQLSTFEPPGAAPKAQTLPASTR